MKPVGWYSISILFCPHFFLREFLTGFHKRKLAKKEAARSKAKEREKQERLETRRDVCLHLYAVIVSVLIQCIQQRLMLRERAIENAAQVEKAYGAVVGRWSFHLNFNQQAFQLNYDIDNDNDDDEWAGLSVKENERDEEYEDEEMLATVTVVEDFDPDTIVHGPPKPNHPPIAQPDHLEPLKPKLSRQLQSNTGSSKKSRPRKIPYETSDARKKERTKQRARRTEKAELAGGKAARKSKSARGVKRKANFKR